MRVWLFNRIRGLAGIPTAFGVGALMRLISSGAVDQPTAPFLVVVMGVEQPVLGMPARTGAATIPVTVWVHDTPGSMLNIDDACVALKNGLPISSGVVVGGMSVYECRWVEIGNDSYDDHYKTNCRPVRFSLTTRR